jgi:Domain of unknown function (DUF5919)
MTVTQAEQTLLGTILRSRHLQEYRAFCRQYEKVARSLDSGRPSRPPSKATFYRWLGGSDKPRVPQPDRCRVLEATFPGCSVLELLARWDGSRPLPVVTPIDPTRQSKALPSPPGGEYADLSAAFATRSEFIERIPPHAIFDRATSIQAAGLSLNLLCQQYGVRRLRALLNRRATLQLLFLDPDGAWIKAREKEENLSPGVLSALTRLNMQMIDRLWRQLPEANQDLVEVRIYDDVIRFNITITDGHRCIVQPYIPAIRGVDSPTLVVDRKREGVGMFATFANAFTSLWSGARKVGS